jgi:hypothetical protein
VAQAARETTKSEKDEKTKFLWRAEVSAQAFSQFWAVNEHPVELL